MILAIPVNRLLPSTSAAIEWPAALLDFQLEGIHALLEKPRILLADDMGLGKTVQAAAAMRILCLRREIEHVLLVVPAGLVDQWRRELAKWAPELRLIAIRGPAQDRAWQWRAEVHVTMVGYETLRTDFSAMAEFGPRLRHWDLVVLDEAQKIKNRDAEVGHQVKQLWRQRSWALTGTPLENSIDDLASVMEFVDHSGDGPHPRYGSTPELLRRHRDLQLRRKKGDVLEQLPPKQVIKLGIQLGPRQRDSYRRAEEEGIVNLRNGDEIRVEHILALITRLKQICNADPASGDSAKFDDMRERLAVLSDEGNRALVFSQYTDESYGVKGVAHALEQFNPLVYEGGMSSGERDEVIQRFKGNTSHKALVLSLKAGGVGLNLQDASYVFHLDRWWNPAAERQAEDRSHRMGQTVPVTVFKYTCEGTIEERIDRILAGKQQLFDEIIDDVSLELDQHLTRDELFGLFGLAPKGPAQAERAPRPSGLELEDRCEQILRDRHWTVQRTPRSHDGGVDLVATKIDEVGLGLTMYVQCKDHARPVGVEIVRELLGVLPPDQTVNAVLASPSGLSSDAAALARRRGVTLWDERVLRAFETNARS